MTIEIHTPELEALILERMKSGAFQNVEEVLLQALRSTLRPVEDGLRSGAELVGAMQASPDREVSLEPTRYRLPVRDVAF